MKNKDYFPKPNTLLHRQIKSIVEQELRDVTKNINREEFLTKLLERKHVHSLISRIEFGYRDDLKTTKIYYKFIYDVF